MYAIPGIESSIGTIGGSDARVVELLRPERTMAEGGAETHLPGMVSMVKKSPDAKMLKEGTLIGHLLEAIPLPVFYIDPSGAYIGCNRAFASFLGKEKEEIPGKNVRDLFPGESGERYLAADNALFENPGTQEYETTVPDRTGGLRHVMVNKATFAGADGRVAGLVGIILDISERKQAEERLKESEQRYRAFFTTSRDPVFITTKEGKWIDFNDATLELFGYSREELLRTEVSAVYKNPEDRIRHTHIIDDQGYIREYPVDLRRADGTTIHALVTTAAMRGADGAVVQFQGTIRDISDQQRLEEERMQHQVQQSVMNQIVAAVASSLGSRELLRTSLLGILRLMEFDAGTAHLLDKDGVRVRLVASEGFQPADGIEVTDLNLQEPRIRAAFDEGKAIYQESPAQGFPGGSSLKVEALAIIPLFAGAKVVGTLAIASRTPHLFTSTEKSMLDSIGREVGTGLVKEMLQEEVNSSYVRSQLYLRELEKTVRERDAEIEGRQQVEQALRLARKKLDLMDSITRHDIINQLMVLMAHLRMSQDRETDAEKRSVIDKELRAAQTIQQQIEFTRDYQDIGSRSPEWVPVGSIIRRLIAGLNLGPIRLVETIGELEVLADLLFEKVIYTLVDNALRYGKVLTKVEFSSHMEGDDLVLVCEDDGVGVPDAHKTGIFHREYFNHTGLGLYLSREILSISGFTIRETGVYGKGAHFEIRIPQGSFRHHGEPVPGTTTT